MRSVASHDHRTDITEARPRTPEGLPPVVLVHSMATAGNGTRDPDTLVTTGRYIKNLPVPRGTTARQKLDAYLASEVGDL
jgi:hypothetical protein